MKNHTAYFSFLLIALFAFASCSSPKVLSVSDIDKKAQRYTSKKKNKGMVVGYIVNGERFVKGYGTKSRTDLSVPDENSIFEIGALTEIFTATLMQQMAEEGMLDPADCANRYINEKYLLPNYVPIECVNFTLPPPPDDPLFPVSFRVTSCSPDITASECVSLCNLAAHTSGLRFPKSKIYSWNPSGVNASWETDEDLTPSQFQKQVSKVGDVIFEPGKYFRYSSTGVAMLGNILEKITQKSYSNMLDSYLLFPLKLDQTGFSNPTIVGFNEKGFAVARSSFDAMSPAAGLTSSTNDLLTFLETQITPSLAFEGAIERTHDIQLKTRSHFGYEYPSAVTNGWFATRFKNSEDMLYWKNGGTKGFNAFMAFNKEKKTAVVILSNSAQSVKEIGFELIEALQHKITFPTADINH